MPDKTVPPLEHPEDHGRGTPLVIAIDGPAGAGKSTVARGLAKLLGLRFLDTGAMYRAVALLAIERGIGLGDNAALGELSRSLAMDFNEAGQVEVDGVCLEPAVRSSEVTRSVSEVSAQGAVREVIVALQQSFGQRWRGLVAEGRDTTTVVFPGARFRFYLDATAQERARRRAHELGIPEEVERIQAEIEVRDTYDSNRQHSPLCVGEGVEVLLTDGLAPDVVIARLLDSVKSQTR